MACAPSISRKTEVLQQPDASSRSIVRSIPPGCQQDGPRSGLGETLVAEELRVHPLHGHLLLLRGFLDAVAVVLLVRLAVARLLLFGPRCSAQTALRSVIRLDSTRSMARTFGRR